jgi:hypothetical protein
MVKLITPQLSNSNAKKICPCVLLKHSPLRKINFRTEAINLNEPCLLGLQYTAVSFVTNHLFEEMTFICNLASCNVEVIKLADVSEEHVASIFEVK